MSSTGLLRPCRFANRCISLKIGLNFDLDQDRRLPSARQCIRAGGALGANHGRSEEGAMRAFSLQGSHRSLPNVFAQSWRRWMMSWADQLLETARLGCDN